MGYVDIAPAARRTTGAKVSVELLPWLLPAAIGVAAILIRVHSLESADVSWLLTLAERLLDGRNDYIEINPPGAILTYVPAVSLSRLLGIAPETACDGLIFLVAALSAGLFCLLVGKQSSERHNLPLLATGVTAILLLLPSYTFGEREHLGVVLLLPGIAVFAMRLGGSPPNIWLRISVGLACGLSIVIKPHFLFAIGLLSCMVAWRMRSWRVLFAAENIAIATVLSTYAATLWLAFPDFLAHTAPIVAAVYVPDRLGIATLLSSPASILLTCTMVLVIALGALRHRDALIDLLLAASAASYLAFVLQGKGWPYQSFPAIGFSLLTLVVLLARASGNATARVSRPLALGLCGTLAIFAGGVVWFNLEAPRDTRAIAQAVGKVAQRPTVAVISGDMSIGFPLTRMVDGNWAQRPPSLWITLSAVRQKTRPGTSQEAVAALDRYEALDRTTLRNDILRNRPNVVLVEAKGPNFFDWLAWARLDPQLARALDNYEFVEQIDDVQILRLR
jgi:hypothetical protein